MDLPRLDRSALDLLRRRPPTAALVYFGVALALAVLAIASVGSYAGRLQATRPDVGPPSAVLMAARRLPPGAVIAPGDVVERTLPATLVPPGSITDPGRAQGRVLIAGIAPGEVLTDTRVARPGAGPLSALVPEGLRAFSFPAAVTAGTLVPGDVVDVIATFGTNGGRPYTDTVASDLSVLRVGAPSDPETPIAGAGGGPPAGSITVLTDTTTVETLARAAATGIISFAVAGADTDLGADAG